jgi:hypothetical protein
MFGTISINTEDRKKNRINFLNFYCDFVQFNHGYIQLIPRGNTCMHNLRIWETDIEPSKIKRSKCSNNIIPKNTNIHNIRIHYDENRAYRLTAIFLNCFKRFYIKDKIKSVYLRPHLQDYSHISLLNT